MKKRERPKKQGKRIRKPPKPDEAHFERHKADFNPRFLSKNLHERRGILAKHERKVSQCGKALLNIWHWMSAHRQMACSC